MNIAITGPRRHNLVHVVAWSLMLLASILPEIILVDVLHRPDLLTWAAWSRLLVMGALALLTLSRLSLQPLWRFATILFVLAAAQEGMNSLRNSGVWEPALAHIANPFAREYLGVQFWKLGITAIMLVGLVALGFQRKDAFLVRGQLDAPITPVKWLGFPRPESWTSFGTKWIVFLSIGMVVLLSLFGTVHRQQLVEALGLWPVILLLSALNAFNEEVTYRSALLAPLVPAVGARSALWIVAVLFAVMHYYSAVNGVTGVLLTIFMGWMLTKAMLETRGFFWPWLLHFSQDVIIFWFIAGGSTLLS
jgi:membrane protease YdiL (CAAX protease family)